MLGLRTERLLRFKQRIRLKVRTAFKELRRIALLPLPGIDRWGTWLPMIFVVFCYGYWRIFPVYPGYCVAALGFAAAVMAVRTDKLHFIEKAVWVLIAAGLVVGEIRVLYTDRIENDREQTSDRQRQQARFEETVRGFANVLDAQGRTLKGVVRANSLTQINLDNIIGSPRSFCAIYPEIDNGRFVGNVAFVKGGPTPLYDVRVGIWVGSAPGVDAQQGGRTPDYLLKDTVISGPTCGAVSTLTLGPAAGTDWKPIVADVMLHAEFSARSGQWYEDMIVRRINGIENSFFVVFRFDQKGKPVELFRQGEKTLVPYPGWPYSAKPR